MTIFVSPTETNPTHHIKLSDGTTSIGLVLRSGNRVDPRAITRRPRQNGQYSPFTQSDWGSGRGIKDAASDRSRFADSKRLITRHPGTAMIGGQETYTTGYRQAESSLPGSMQWLSLLTSVRYIAAKVTASATGNRKTAFFWIRRRGTPTSTLTVELCSNNSGAPGTVLKTVTVTTSNITDTISQLYPFSFSSVQAVTSTTIYYLKIYTSSADSSANCWQVGTGVASAATSKVSADGSSWSLATGGDLYFRLIDDSAQLGALFFNYKNQLYMVTRPASSDTPQIFVNGDRGVATGTHSTTTLQDSTKTWTVNAWAGSILLIIAGTNSEWQASYRTVISNTADTLTFAAFPKAPVSNDTTYVILGSNVWTEITGHGLTVLPTSVVSTGEIVYFAQGDLTQMRRMREYNNNAVWTREFAAEDNYAKFLIDFRHPTRGLFIGKANDYDNSGQPSFAQASVEAWGRRLLFPYLITDCETATGWTAGTGAAVTADNTDFVTKTKSIKIVVSSGPADPVAYFVPSAAVDIRGHRALRFWFKSSVNLAEAAVKIFLSISATAASTIQDLSLPAVVGGQWVQITLPYIDTAAGLGVVASIGIRVTAAATYHIDGLETVPSGSETQLGNPVEKITGLNRYGDPEVPWVFRAQSAGSVEDGVYSPVPVRELSTAQSIYNGAGSVVHNVYLYFSFLHGLERFYRNNLDDVGPNRDEGLPSGRRGYITSMQAYIGRFFENYDSLDGYSCIMESTNGGDHHETFRSDTVNKRIRNLFIQAIPGDTADRLWFTEGNDVVWLPLPGNTLKEDTDSTFRFTHEAYLETGWLYGTEQDAVKAYHSVKLFTENLSANRCIEWDYKKNEDSSWTPVATPFTSSPVQEVGLNVSAKRIKFRFRFQTNDNTQGPILKSLFAGATTRPETRWTYSMNTLFADNAIDLQGEEDSTVTAAALVTQLDTWMKNNTVLTMSSLFAPFHNKSVMLEPVVVQPLSIITDEGTESLLGTITLIEPVGYSQ